MKKITCIALLIIGSLISDLAHSQGGCATDLLGKPFCAPAGGSAVSTLKGVACAPGKCVTDNLGYVKCSSELGGGVAKDNLGRVVCVGKCVNPSKEFCVEMKQDKTK
jgi:hypothetical protein